MVRIRWENTGRLLAHRLSVSSLSVINVVLFLFAAQNGYDRTEFSLCFFNCSDYLNGNSNNNNSNAPMYSSLLITHHSRFSHMKSSNSPVKYMIFYLRFKDGGTGDNKRPLTRHQPGFAEGAPAFAAKQRPLLTWVLWFSVLMQMVRANHFANRKQAGR